MMDAVMRYVTEEGDWMAFANAKSTLVIAKSTLVMDTKDDHIVCECTYEEDAEKICKLLNEAKE